MSVSKNQQYFSESVEVASNRSSIELALPDLSLVLTTDSGVFSQHQIDVGTKYLLMAGPEPVVGDQNLADVGCGYGPIALALAKRNPAAQVWAIDVNERARSLTRLNAVDNELDNVMVASPDEVPADLRFDRIWSNPPIRIGKPALHDLLQTWLGRLAADGSAHLVVQKHLGSDSLTRWLNEQGWPTTRRSSRKAYRILDLVAKQRVAE